MTTAKKIRDVVAALDPRADNLVEACQQWVAADAGSLALVGLMLKQDSVVLDQAGILALRDAPENEELWTCWAALLLPPFRHDLTSQLNILTGVVEPKVWKSSSSNKILSVLFADFLDHALTERPLVAERAVDLLNVLPPEALGSLDAESAVSLFARARSVASKVDDNLVRDELTSCVDHAERTRSVLPSLTAREIMRLRAGLDFPKSCKTIDPLVNRVVGVVDAYLASASVEKAGRPVQHIRVRSAGRSQSALDGDRVWPVTRAWNNFYRRALEQYRGLELALLPVSAQPGSFHFDLVIDADAEAADQALEVSDCLMNALVSDEEPDLPSDWRELLDVLTSNNLSMEIQHFLGSQTRAKIDLNRRTVRAARQKIGRAPTRPVDSVLVPQADRLEKVFKIVDLMAKGETVNSETLELVQRQVAYYKRAAKILGLLDEDGALSASGRQFTRLDAEQRLRSCVVLFENCQVGEAWIAWSDGTTLLDVDPEKADEFLAVRTTGLSGDTVGRRAKTLQTWHGILAPYHYARADQPRSMQSCPV